MFCTIFIIFFNYYHFLFFVYFRFVIVLLITLVVGLVALLRQSSTFLILFIREFGVFIHRATPFLQTIIAFFEKIVGGFYLLLAMVYKDVRKPAPPQPPPSYSEPPRPIKYIPPEAWAYRRENAGISSSNVN